jgi:hypothetical protein
MALIDLILNIAGLLLWLNWRPLPQLTTIPAPGRSLASTLRRASAPRQTRWWSLAAMAVLLLVRSVFYQQIGSSLNWTGMLDLVVITLPFRSDLFERTLLFSVLSFAKALWIVHLWLLLVSVLNHGDASLGPAQRLAAWLLGRVHRWPRAVKALLPFLGTALLWAVLSLWLVRIELLPRPETFAALWLQAGMVGLCAYLAWVPLLACVLGLHVIESHVYLGKFAFWDIVNSTARVLVSFPGASRLKWRQVDLAPLMMLVLVLLAGHFAWEWLEGAFPGVSP